MRSGQLQRERWLSATVHVQGRPASTWFRSIPRETMGEVHTTLTVMVPGAGLSPDRKEHREKGFHISTESRQLFLRVK